MEMRMEDEGPDSGLLESTEICRGLAPVWLATPPPPPVVELLRFSVDDEEEGGGGRGSALERTGGSEWRWAASLAVKAELCYDH